jgi:hypothetical protein
MERGPLSLLRITEELRLRTRKLRLTTVGDPPRSPRDTPLSTKVGIEFRRSVGIVRLWTKGHGVCSKMFWNPSSCLRTDVEGCFWKVERQASLADRPTSIYNMWMYSCTPKHIAGSRLCAWVRHYVTSREVMCWIVDEITGCFQFNERCSGTIVLGLSHQKSSWRARLITLSASMRRLRSADLWWQYINITVTVMGVIRRLVFYLKHGG